MALNRQAFADILAEARGEASPALIDAPAKDTSPVPDQQPQRARKSPEPPATTTTSTPDVSPQQPLEMSAKRSSAYKHGQPGREYEERRDEPAEEPKRATAAQLAQRK